MTTIVAAAPVPALASVQHWPTHHVDNRWKECSIVQAHGKSPAVTLADERATGVIATGGAQL